jgi:quinohemoprotein ethanol dehydrogenase
LTGINASNVKSLQGAWFTRLNGSGLDPKTTQEATPIVRDGIMYLPTRNMDIFALNAKTGTILLGGDAHGKDSSARRRTSE